MKKLPRFKIENMTTASKMRKGQYMLDICIVLLMGSLLYYGVAWQLNNPLAVIARYQCYAVAFWQGEQAALHTLPAVQCSFLTRPAIMPDMKALGTPLNIFHSLVSQSPSQSFHILPSEYPLLSLVPFSLGLLVPQHLYALAFVLWMALATAIVYFILKYSQSTLTAIVFAFYLVIGAWATALETFDIIPSALTLVALICAERARWRWAFALLALATMVKFYPFVLIIPFFIAQQLQLREKWRSWRRWDGLIVFTLVCTALMLLSLLLSVENTLVPFSYFGNRPIQVESFPASLLWLTSFLGFPLHYTFTFGSLNVLGTLSSRISLLATLCLIVGLLYTFWLQWRGKLQLAPAVLLTLLIVIITSKVFSPQYFIWVTPLVAYVGKSNWRWIITWGCIGLLTTWIYPFIYTAAPNIISVPLLPAFFPVAFVRNGLILTIVLVLFYKASHTRIYASQTSNITQS